MCTEFTYDENVIVIYVMLAFSNYLYVTSFTLSFALFERALVVCCKVQN